MGSEDSTKRLSVWENLGMAVAFFLVYLCWLRGIPSYLEDVVYASVPPAISTVLFYIRRQVMAPKPVAACL